jgi:uncharacterized membrane protein YhdT
MLGGPSVRTPRHRVLFGRCHLYCMTAITPDQPLLLQILASGLADGFNPCTFSVLVFLVSFLTFTGRTKREIFLTGGVFTAAVFVTYFFLMLGMMATVQQAIAFKVVSVAVSAFVVILSATLAVMNVVDVVRYRRTGRTTESFVQLPMFIKQKIHGAIRTGLSSTRLVLAALPLGFFVALFESLCSGTMMLPTIRIMLHEPDVWDSGPSARALMWLVAYNLAFIAPLIVVFVLSYFGTTSKMLQDFGRKHFELSKIILALVFVWFTIVLVVMGIRDVLPNAL